MENKFLDLSGIPTPQLREIKKILTTGVQSNAEERSTIKAGTSQLCNKSAPKGYPKNKSEYGDPECYRYPLDTKSRCLAAWRYVHQKDNWSILGDKAKSVESKIKSYAKKHYNLDLQTGESEAVDWEQIFVDYYDGETMGERCELIVLEPEESEEKINEVKTMEDKERIAALEQENTTLKADKASLEAKVIQLETVTKELDSQKAEFETLRKFKTDTEAAAEKAKRIQLIKSKLDEAGLDSSDAKVDLLIGMSDEVLAKIIAEMSDIKKGAQASAEKKDIKVPPVVSGDNKTDARSIVADGLKERKQERNKR